MKSTIPGLVIHGGFESDSNEDARERSLIAIAEAIYPLLCSTTAKEAVFAALMKLEDDPLFNAGRGSYLQQDGIVRMSGSFMDGRANKFAAIINIQNVQPSEILRHLCEEEKHTSLAGEIARAYAEKKGVNVDYDAMTPESVEQYEQKIRGITGTVGAVALDKEGNICAGTSTGGIGFEIPGRVSDSSSVAGNYASNEAGVSCTGVGENITNLSVASRIVTRVADGMPLAAAVAKTIEEGNAFGYRFGLISLDKEGNIVVGETANCKVRQVSINESGLHSWRKP